MKYLILILTVLVLSCKKDNNSASKTITVTYYVNAKLNPREKLYVQYVTNYGPVQYQYGNLQTDTLNTDSFSVTVNYSVNNAQMKGQAGYFAATTVYYPYNGSPYLESYPNIKAIGSIVNGVYSYTSPYTTTGLGYVHNTSYGGYVYYSTYQLRNFAITYAYW